MRIGGSPVMALLEHGVLAAIEAKFNLRTTLA